MTTANRESSLTQSDFKSILIVKPSSLGDVVHCLPLLHGLRVRYPEAHIAWLVADAFAELIEGHPELDEVIRFDRKRYGSLGRSFKPSVEFLRFVRSLRARSFKLAIDVQGLFRSGFLTLMSGAPVRIGLSSARELATVFYTHRIRDDDAEMHAADRNFLVGESLGFSHVPLQFDLAVTDTERRKASNLIAEVGLGQECPFLAILPGARWETKKWSTSRFAELIDRAQSEHGIRSVLLAGPSEVDVCDFIASASTSKPINLAGRTGIRDMVAILERAAAVISHDSAPMHIAAALGRPLVALLGPTNRRRTGPYGQLDSVMQADLPCVPCYLKSLSQCPYHHQCMDAIDVAGVARLVGRKLIGTAGASRILST